jgi:hypothetical protein
MSPKSIETPFLVRKGLGFLLPLRSELDGGGPLTGGKDGMFYGNH